MLFGVLSLTIVCLVCLILVSIYNRLIKLKNRFLNGFSQIDVQLQRRYELIPNLVETAKAYMKHENDTLTAVIEARNRALQGCQAAARDPEDASLLSALSDAENRLSNAMGQFNVVMENYPELKADVNMHSLQEELTSTENRVAFARQAYSDAVMEYNIACQQFPAVLFARLFAFNEAELFDVTASEMKQVVTVSFA